MVGSSIAKGAAETEVKIVDTDTSRDVTTTVRGAMDTGAISERRRQSESVKRAKRHEVRGREDVKWMERSTGLEGS